MSFFEGKATDTELSSITVILKVCSLDIPRDKHRSSPPPSIVNKLNKTILSVRSDSDKIRIKDIKSVGKAKVSVSKNSPIFVYYL